MAENSLPSLIRFVYITAIIFWIMVIYYFNLYDMGFLSYFFILIPIIIFLLGYVHADVIDERVEKEVFQASFLAIGLLVILPVLNWMKQDCASHDERFMRLMIFAITLSLFGALDVWLPFKYIRITKHIRSALETISLILFVFVLYIYYIDSSVTKCPSSD